MEVKATGSMTVNELYSKVQASRVHQEQAQGSGEEALQKNYHDASKTNDKSWTKEELATQIDAMNKLVELKFTSLEFEQHEKLDRTIVRVIDRDTEEVIKEIPPQKFLDMISSMLEFAGIIIDEKI